MKRFRSLVAGVCALAITLPAAAAPCVQPVEKAGFDLHAFQSRLMVVALTCQDEGGAVNGYNGLVRRFQHDLKGAYDRVIGHFRTRGGNRKFDDYVTNLANTQSQENMSQGDFLCRNYAPTWQKLGAMTTIGELVELAGATPGQTFYPLDVCAPRPQRAPAATPRPRTTPVRATAQ
jgi:hypothetical protein